MRKTLLFIAVMCIFLSFDIATALAEHTSRDMFWDDGHHSAERLNETHTENFCITSEFDAALTTTQVSNLKNSLTIAFNRWLNNTDIDADINLGPGADGNGTCGSNFNFRVGWENAEVGHTWPESVLEDYCEHRPPNAVSSVHYEDLSWMDTGASTIAYTVACDLDDNQFLDFFVMVIDPRSDWMWANGSQPNPGDLDFPSVATHEAGHAYGFARHWNNGSDACVVTEAGLNTMCQGNNIDNWKRTLESHDIAETNQAYP